MQEQQLSALQEEIERLRREKEALAHQCAALNDEHTYQLYLLY